MLIIGLHAARRGRPQHVRATHRALADAGARPASPGKTIARHGRIATMRSPRTDCRRAGALPIDACQHGAAHRKFTCGRTWSRTIAREAAGGIHERRIAELNAPRRGNRPKERRSKLAISIALSRTQGVMLRIDAG
ncbi:hypothetical protein I6G56_12540 [Burkholderia humptydooensis]|uniref:Uncharacterized protein n=1 Tax=Burkholderia humptydooensis TaxID=430531 RepID=A0A7T2WWT7_9BURK|nr:MULTISPECIES: hypothetical protein [Burkholderia]QPS42447.1 hypothetical protein I6G56_12540 [Burkholderia humptydooensis]